MSTTTTTSKCPECDGPAQVWADHSDGVTVNFACDNDACASGRGPWDTPRPADPFDVHSGTVTIDGEQIPAEALPSWQEQVSRPGRSPYDHGFDDQAVSDAEIDAELEVELCGICGRVLTVGTSGTLYCSKSEDSRHVLVDEVDDGPEPHRTPYVGAGAEGARASAQIDREESHTLDAGDVRQLELEESARRWDQQARELERG